MPAAVSSRSRKADSSLGNEPATKKQRTTASIPAKSLNDALFANGAPKKLSAKKTAPQQSKSAHVVQDAKSSISTTVGQRPVTKQVDVVEISSDDSSDDSEEEEGDAVEDIASEADEVDEGADESPQSDSDKENMMEIDDATADEPTFGELLQAAPIDVQAALQGDHDSASAPLAPHLSSRKLVLSSTTSLATVLAQALKTNDRDLLESCFTTNDLESVRGTITRLPSPLVGQLLLYIADKLHKRPGRASNLMVWIQWSLVSHGGYLARRPDVVSKLGALNRVIRERANGLQPLMVLKGKLDMLSAQLELRREMMEANRNDQDDDEDVVIYVEGQDDLIVSGTGDKGSEDEDEDGVDLDDIAAIGAVDFDEDEDEDDDDDEEVSSDDDDDDEVSEDGFSDQAVEEASEPSDLEDDSDDEIIEAPKLDKGKKRKL